MAIERNKSKQHLQDIKRLYTGISEASTACMRSVDIPKSFWVAAPGVTTVPNGTDTWN